MLLCPLQYKRALRGLARTLITVEAEEVARTVTVTWDPKTTDWNAIDSLLREIDFAPAE